MTSLGSTLRGATPLLPVNQISKHLKLTACLWNSHSIVNKLRNFQPFIYTQDFSLIVISETWLHDYIYNKEILSTGYTIYRKDRCSKGGGVMLAVKSTFKTTELASPDNLEIVTISVHSHHNLIICAVYLPPNYKTDHVQDLYSYITTLSCSGDVILLGDFNASDIDWQTFASTADSSDRLCDLIIDHNLFQHVTVPTHIHGNILDLVITSDTDLINDLVVHPLTDFPLQSDHFIITFSICASVHHHNSRNGKQLTYNLNKTDWLGLNQFIAFNNADAIFYSDNIEITWARLKDLLHESMDKYIPKKQQHPPNRPQWFTSEIQHCLNKLHTIRKKVKRNPTEHNKSTLKSAEENLQQLITSSRQAYESSLVEQYSSSNSNRIYKVISSLKNNRSIPAAMSLDSDSCDDDLGIANGFNKYFHSVFTKSFMDQPQTADNPSDIPAMSSIDIQPEEVFECLSSLDASKAAGIDAMSPEVLKQCADPITPIVHHLINLSITSCSLPSEWQTHLIVPIHKSGPKTDIKNYRPISLLCILSKIWKD